MKSIATDNSADIHLCISLDDSIPQLYSTISGMTLLLVDRQRRWADQEKEKISNGGKYFTCNPRKNEVEKVEAILHQAIELCMKNLKEESALLEPDWANLNIIKPRAIRIIYSTTRDLINGCLDYPGEGFSIFPGISKNSVWNLWLSKEILDTMDVLSWGNTTEKELKENAGNTPPKWIKYFRPLKADKSLFDLINDMAGACRFTVNFDTICKQYTEYCHKPDGPDVKNLQQMCIGEHYWIKSGDLQFANPATEKGTCKSAFFELLPVILMALHCKKLIPFEDAIQWAATLEDYADEQIDLKIQEKEAEIQNWIET